MTAIVGILCQDGIVVGTDSSATFGVGELRTIEQKTEKITIIDDKIIVAGTGQIGLNQRFCEIVKDCWDNKIFKDPYKINKELSKRFIQDISETFLDINPRAPNKFKYGALLAYPLKHDYWLCEFDENLFQPEYKSEKLWYCSMRSAQSITDPFLGLMREIYWEDEIPNVNQAIFATTWTLDHAVKVNAGGVNKPIKLAVLEQNNKKEFRARKLEDEDLAEYRQHVDLIKLEMKEGLKLTSETVKNIPDVS